MKIMVIGGNGLLGTHTVREAMERGHQVGLMSRTRPVTDPAGDEALSWVRADVHALSRPELALILAGHDAVVYSLGMDDRFPHPRPAYPVFHHDHVTVCQKVLEAARDAGVSRFVVFGSYFTHFDRVHPRMDLGGRHIYIRTRREQRDMVLQANGPGFRTCVLEIPYVIGALPGKVPPWSFLFDMIAGSGKSAWFFGKGGTAAVTPAQIAQAAMGAIENDPGGKAWPLGGINLDWTELAERFLAIRGTPKRLLPLPRLLFSLFGMFSAWVLAIRGLERGLSISHFARFHYLRAFIDPEPSMAALGYRHDDYDRALRTMVKEWELSRHRKNRLE